MLPLVVSGGSQSSCPSCDSKKHVFQQKVHLRVIRSLFFSQPSLSVREMSGASVRERGLVLSVLLFARMMENDDDTINDINQSK